MCLVAKKLPRLSLAGRETGTEGDPGQAVFGGAGKLLLHDVPANTYSLTPESA